MTTQRRHLVRPPADDSLYVYSPFYVDDLILTDRNAATQAAGAFDTSFNGSGTLTTDVGGNMDSAMAVAVQHDGKYVVVGSSLLYCLGSGWHYNVSVVRYNPDGSLDASFNGNGKKIINVINGQDSQAASVFIENDGKILVGGTVGTDFCVLRLNSEPDPPATCNCPAHDRGAGTG